MRIAALAVRESVTVRDIRIGLYLVRRMWCTLMHDNLSWPMHGRYVCRRCGIVYNVPWRPEQQEDSSCESMETLQLDSRRASQET